MEGNEARKTILVVDDEQSYRKVLHELLEAAGYNVLSAWSAKDALAVCEQGRAPIDLLLADVLLPEALNGAELAERMRHLYPGLQVLYFTGHPDHPVVTRLRQEHPQQVLLKPLGANELLTRIRAVLQLADLGSPQRPASNGTRAAARLTGAAPPPPPAGTWRSSA